MSPRVGPVSRRTGLPAILMPMLLIAACAGSGDGDVNVPSPSSAANASTVPQVSTPATDVPTPTPHIFSAQGGTVSGTDRYRSFRQWAALWPNAALVRVVEIGPPQWNTKDGRLPPGLDFLDPVPGNPNVLRILRPIRMELVRVLRGSWPPDDVYGLRWGGRVGNDIEETDPDPFPPKVGQEVIAFAPAQPIDLGAAFPLWVVSGFPVDASGRVLTPEADREPDPNPDQTLPPADPPAGITLDEIESYLP